MTPKKVANLLREYWVKMAQRSDGLDLGGVEELDVEKLLWDGLLIDEEEEEEEEEIILVCQ
jgi:hypothetical protein